MAGLIESYKKVYQNKKAHIWLFIIAFAWSLLSNLCDIAMGKPDNYRQNPFDLVFNCLVGMYSLQFLHNAVFGNDWLPLFKEINWRALPGLIGLNIVWGFYLALVLILAVFSYFAMHNWILPIIVMLFVLLISVFIYYIYLAYAEDFHARRLFDIRLIFIFIKNTFKETYIKLALFVLVTLAFVILYLILYIGAGLLGIDKVGQIAQDYYLFDVVMFAIIGYFLIVTWFFVFPYSLINTYIEKVRPAIKGEPVDE